MLVSSFSEELSVGRGSSLTVFFIWHVFLKSEKGIVNRDLISTHIGLVMYKYNIKSTQFSNMAMQLIINVIFIQVIFKK